MPKDTFFNLPEEKRQKIVEAAMLEFENNSFDSASINQIISVAQISKGSFYQYFEDKKDLYMHLTTRQPAQTAEKNVMFLSSQTVAGQFTAASATQNEDHHEDTKRKLLNL